ncbi:hypothetical protein [Mycobacterium neglectum]|uniref:hypothetical protein n=1 Tax=Mycobacterium neglectum TaxID=242737 RepID=UPI001145F798|nr:hypothetical protein [Mycobacterium neglectum]
MARRSDGGGGFVAVFAILFVVGLIIKYIWWIVGAAALVGGIFVVRALVRHAEQRRLEAAERDAELARRAEQQHRWTLRGDTRGVYGPAGAKRPCARCRLRHPTSAGPRRTCLGWRRSHTTPGS